MIAPTNTSKLTPNTERRSAVDGNADPSAEVDKHRNARNCLNESSCT